MIQTIFIFVEYLLKRRRHGGQLVSTFASHCGGEGFDSGLIQLLCPAPKNHYYKSILIKSDLICAIHMKIVHIMITLCPNSHRDTPVTVKSQMKWNDCQCNPLNRIDQLHCFSCLCSPTSVRNWTW